MSTGLTGLGSTLRDIPNEVPFLMIVQMHFLGQKEIPSLAITERPNFEYKKTKGQLTCAAVSMGHCPAAGRCPGLRGPALPRDPV